MTGLATPPASGADSRHAFVRARLPVHVFTFGLLAAWQLASLALPPILLPGPLAVAAELLRFVSTPRDLAHLVSSITHVLVAIAASFVLGSLLALLADRSPLARFAIERRIGPFLNAFSGVGWALLATMWFGIGSSSVVFAIGAVLVPFALVNTSAGLASLDREIGEMATSFGRRRWRRFRLVTVPLLVPFVVATLRIMFGVAWKVTLTAELLGGSKGLGYVINMARQDFDTARIFVVIVLIIAFVHTVDRLVFAPIQRWLARQHAG
ncbi:MAG: ABC transporter permease [Lautropia sp.]